MKIDEAIKQKAFLSEYHKAHINLFYTQAWLELNMIQELKPFNISPQQFNILRILRGQLPNPASVKELTDRMIDKASNASRLVDKLLDKGFVTKNACEKDHRRMEIMITTEGLDLLAAASQAVESSIIQIFSVLSVDEAEQLNSFLDRLRG